MTELPDPEPVGGVYIEIEMWRVLEPTTGQRIGRILVRDEGGFIAIPAGLESPVAAPRSRTHWTKDAAVAAVLAAQEVREVRPTPWPVLLVVLAADLAVLLVVLVVR